MNIARPEKRERPRYENGGRRAALIGEPMSPLHMSVAFVALLNAI